MRYISLLMAMATITLTGCVEYHVMDGAYVDNKVYLVALKTGNAAEYFVTRCTADENANLACKRVQINKR